MITIQQPISWAIAQPIVLGQGGGVFVVPPVSEELLVWLKGNSTDTQKLDSWKRTDAENFTMSGSHCVALNGTDEYGTLDSAVTLVGDSEVTFECAGFFETVISSVTTNLNYVRFVSATQLIVKLAGGYKAFTTPIAVGTFRVIREGAAYYVYHNDILLGTEDCTTDDIIFDSIGYGLYTLIGSGNLYNLLLKDSTQDIHFRMAEGSGLTSFSDDYETDGHYISWTAVEADLWAQRQDSYHGNSGGYGKRENLITYSGDLTIGSKLENEVTIDHTDGINTFTETLSTSKHNVSIYDIPAYTDGTFRFLVKANGRDELIVEKSSWGVTKFNLSTVSVTSGVGTITDKGDGWYECIAGRYTASPSQTVIYFGLLSAGADIYTGDGVSGVLIKECQFVASLSMSTYIQTQDFTLTGQEYLPFLNDEKGNTFNDCETSYAPEEFPVGTFNGIDDKIALNGPNLISDISVAFKTDSTAEQYVIGSGSYLTYGFELHIWNATQLRFRTTYAGVNTNKYITVGDITDYHIFKAVLEHTSGDYYNVTLFVDDVEVFAYSTQVVAYSGTSYIGWNEVAGKYFSGIIRDVNINGTLIPINEGEGTDIHDSEGNLVGTLSGDATFWEGAPMVAQSIMDAEAVQGSTVFTDGEGHALPMTQAGWSELGEELVEDPEFLIDVNVSAWSRNANWLIDGNGYAIADGTSEVNPIFQGNVVTSGVEYQVTFRIFNYVQGIFYIDLGYGGFGTDRAGNGTFTENITAAAGNNRVYVRLKDFGQGSIDIVSVREVNPVMNVNKQYYFCPKAGLFINKRVLTDAEHLEYVEFMYRNCEQQYEALYNDVSGELVYDDASLKLLYDENA